MRAAGDGKECTMVMEDKKEDASCKLRTLFNGTKETNFDDR